MFSFTDNVLIFGPLTISVTSPSFTPDIFRGAEQLLLVSVSIGCGKFHDDLNKDFLLDKHSANFH